MALITSDDPHRYWCSRHLVRLALRTLRNPIVRLISSEPSSTKEILSSTLLRYRSSNTTVRWSGINFWDHIVRVIPNDIVKMVFSQRGGLPNTDEEFLSVVQEAGLVYENMLAHPGMKGKGEPDSTSRHSKSGRQPRESSRSGPNPSSSTQSHK